MKNHKLSNFRGYITESDPIKSYLNGRFEAREELNVRLLSALALVGAAVAAAAANAAAVHQAAAAAVGGALVCLNENNKMVKTDTPKY